jgi:predicted dehydrogenase
VNRDLEANLPKLGVIGLGKMGLLHSGIHSALAGEPLTAVCEKDGTISRIAKKAMPHVRIYENYNQMLATEKLDAVIVTTPVQTHANIILDLIRSNAGLGIFVEKPLAANCDEAMKISKAAKDVSGVHMVGFQKRYAATFAKAKEILASGDIGQLQFFRGHIFSSDVLSGGEGWRLKKGSGGVAIDLGPHVVDMILWYFGEPSKVTGVTKSIYSAVEDFAHATLEFTDGLVGHIDMCWSIRNYRLPELYLEVHGSNGILIVNDDQVKLQLDIDGKNLPVGNHVFRRAELQPSVSFLLGDPEFTLEDEAFRSALLNKKLPDSNFFEGAKVNEIIDKILGRLH